MKVWEKSYRRVETAAFILALAALSMWAPGVMAQSGPVTMEVYPSSAPNAYGSPSYAGWVANAVYAIEHDLAAYGDSSLPTYFQRITLMTDRDNIVTGFKSWKGHADPGAVFGTAYANELGNRATYGVHILGHGPKIRLSNLIWNMHSSDPTNSLAFVGTFSGATYDSLGGRALGIDYGPDGIKGTGDDVRITTGSASQPVDEIVFAGRGNAYDAYCPGCTTTAQFQAAIDTTRATYTSLMPFQQTTDYILYDDSHNTLASGSGTTFYGSTSNPPNLSLSKIHVGTMIQGDPGTAAGTVTLGPVANATGTTTTSAPGFGPGAWQAGGTAKAEVYVTPAQLFGHPVKVQDIASVSWWTNKASGPQDWYALIYTARQNDGGDSGSWFRSRLNSEPYLSGGTFAPGAWAAWSATDATHPLRFYDAIRNGGIYGTYTDPLLSAITGGAVTWPSSGTTWNYSGEQVLSFSMQTGSGWASGFTGLLDGLTVTLKNGESATVNFEAYTNTYLITVSNASGAGVGPTDGTTVTVTDTLPAGLAATAFYGLGWTTNLTTLTATRTDVLGPGQSYPPLILKVAVDPSTAPSVTNTATVTWGVSAAASATDPTIVKQVPTQLVFSAQPSSAMPGATLSPAVVVQVQDAGNQVVADYAGSVTLALSGGTVGAVLTGGGATAAVSGAATFSGLSVDLMGMGYTLSASAPYGSGTLAGTSASFNILNPTPALTSLSPFELAPGQPAFTLTVNGANFVSGATVYFNGVAMTTSFVSATQLTAAIPAARVAAAGTFPVLVRNPPIVLADSNTLTFTVARPTVVYVDDDWAALLPGACPDGSHYIGYDAFAVIQDGVNAVSDSGTVNVAAGTYLAEVSVGRGILLHGAGIDATILMGRKDAGDANTLTISGSNVTVEGLTITRDGNNTTDWNTNVKNQGVIFNQGITGSTLRYCKVTGNRNGVYINNAQGNTIRNNVIDFNRTGMQFANNITGTVIRDNYVTNNWTMGILFNFDGPAPNATTSVTVADNSISGNWYSQVECRWTNSTAILDVSGNWLGSATPTTSASNAGEPGYTDQVPTAYGGSATPPATPGANVGGVTSNRIDYTPWLNSGTDTDPGTIGFQGDFSYLNVGAASPQSGSLGRIAEGIGLVTSAGTVKLTAGEYVENAVITKPLTLFGADRASTILRPSVSQPQYPANPCSMYGAAAGSTVLLVQADDVTVHDLTVDGTNAALDPGNGVSLGGVTVHARGGIVADGTNPAKAYTNFTVHHCDVKNIYLRGIFAASQGPSHTLDFHDNTVDNVQGDDCAIGIFSRFGSGSVTNNTATRCLDAISSNWSQGLTFSGNAVSSPGTGYETVGLHTDNAGWGGTADTLAGNQVTGCDRGIFVFYPHQAVTVTGNTVAGCGIGIALHGGTASGATSTFSGNTITGPGAGVTGSVGFLLTSQFPGFGAANASALFSGNTVRQAAVGVDVHPLAMSVSLTGTGNTVTNDGTGLAIESGSNSVSFTENDLSANITGAANASLTTAGVTCNWWGSASGPSSASNPGGTGTSASGPLTFAPWRTSAGGDCNGTVATHLAFTVQPSNAFTGQVVSPAVVVQVLDASNQVAVGFGGTITLTLSGGTPGAVLSGGSAVAVNGVATFPALSVNLPGYGYAMTASFAGLASATSTAFNIWNQPTVTYANKAWTGLPANAIVFANGGPHIMAYDAFAVIQDALSAVASTGTTYVYPTATPTDGYLENLTITKALTLAKAPDAGASAVVVYPSFSAPRPAGCAGSLCAGSSNIVIVQANNVTIHDLTLDGDNPNLTSGILSNGVDVDARNGIITNHGLGTFNNLTIYNCTVKNIYLRGIYASSGGTFYIHDNTVDNVAGESQSIALFNFGGGGDLTDGSTNTSSFVANHVSRSNDGIVANWSTGTQFLNNTITTSGSGVHTDNASGPGAELVQGNAVTSGTTNAYGIFVFAPFVPVTVKDNTISGVSVGLAASGSNATPAPLVTFDGNAVDGTGVTGAVGAYVTTDEWGWGYNDVSALFTYNVLKNCDEGLYIEHPVAGGAKTANVTAHYNDLSANVTYGVDNTPAVGTVTVADATCNWWGAASGPYSATANPSGTGSPVTTGVVFAPWSTATPPVFNCSGCVTPSAANDGPVCVGATLNLTASPTVPGATYAWTGPNGFTSSLQNPSIAGVTIAAAGTYTVTVTVGICTTTATTTITVLTAPAITADPAPAVVCQGGSATLSVSATGSGLSFTWYKVGNPTAVATGNPVTLGPLAPGDAGDYYAVVTGTCGTATSGTATLTVIATPPTNTYVDDDYAGLSVGTVVTWPRTGGSGTHLIGCDAFATVQGGMDAVAAGGTVNVAAGSYPQNLTVTKALTLLGPNAGTKGYDARAAEAVLMPSTVGYDPYNSATSTTILRITAANVTVNGFTFDGDNPSLTGIDMDGANADACSAISTYASDTGAPAAVGGLAIQDNVVKNFTYAALDLEATGAMAVSGSLVKDNAFDNLSPTDTPATPFGIGVYVGDNHYASITGNHMTRVRKGVQTGNFNLANPGAAAVIGGNVIDSWRTGIWHNLHYQSASPFEIADNTMTAAVGSTSNVGLRITSIQSAVSTNLHDNAISGGYAGIELWNLPTSSGISISGGSVTGAQTGVLFWNDELNPPDGTTGYGKAPGGSVSVSGLSITGCTAYGIRLWDDPTNSDPAAALTLTGSGLTLTGDVVGLRVENARATASITQSDLSGNTTFGASNAGGTLTSTCDWWGSATGPYNATSNPGGAGSPVSSAVIFAPWSTTGTAPYDCLGCLTPTASSNSPICEGATLNLTTPSIAGATYSWSGPNSFSSSLQNPSIAAATTAASGTYTVTVTVGSCTSSGTTSVTVGTVPTITSLSPNQLALGQPDFTMTVNGTGFFSGAVVSFNGVAMTTTFVSSTQVTAAIPASAVATAGTYPVTVTNPAPASCVSNAVNFSVSCPGTVWVNIDWLNYAAGTAVTVSVPGPGTTTHTIGYDAFWSVQAGHDALCASGGTEYVLPGDYQEKLIISKPLTLLGPHYLDNPNATSWLPLESQARIWKTGNGGKLNTLAAGSSGTTIKGLTWTNESTDHIIYSKTQGINNVTVENNYFNSNAHPAIEQDMGSNGTLFSGSGWTIRNNRVVSSPSTGGAGFDLQNLSSSLVMGNSFSSVQNGIQMAAVVGTQVTANTFTGLSGASLQILTGCGDLNVDGNAITGNGTTSTGIEIYGGTTGSNAFTHNVIHGCVAGVSVPSGQSVSANVHVNTNDLSGNTVGASNAGTGTLDATCNWWGSGMGPTHPSNTNPATGVPVTNGVTFEPWSSAFPPLFNCDGRIRSMNPSFASATALPSAAEAATQQFLSLNNPAGSLVPASFSFAWQTGFVFQDFTVVPAGAPVGFWQEMRPWAASFVPTASYAIVRIDATHAFVDVNGNGVNDGLGTDYDVLLDPLTRTVTISRTVTPQNAVESQNVGYRLILQSPLVQNPVVPGDYTVSATLTAGSPAILWSGSATETIEPPGAGCEPGALHDVGDSVRITKSGSDFTIAWSPDPAPSDCMVGYAVYASSNCKSWSSFALFATVDKNSPQNPMQVLAGTGVNLTYFLVAEVDATGQSGPTGWTAP